MSSSDGFQKLAFVYTKRFGNKLRQMNRVFRSLGAGRPRRRLSQRKELEAEQGDANHEVSISGTSIR